jgi:hypothetical protein
VTPQELPSTPRSRRGSRGARRLPHPAPHRGFGCGGAEGAVIPTRIHACASTAGNRVCRPSRPSILTKEFDDDRTLKNWIAPDDFESVGGCDVGRHRR